MSRNASGTYSLPPGYFVETGDTILPAQHNPVLEDIRDEMTDSLSRSGKGALLADVSAGGFDIADVGSLELKVPSSGTTLIDNVAIDLSADLLRVYEVGGAKGFSIDTSTWLSGTTGKLPSSEIGHKPADTGATAATLFNILNYKIYAENFSTVQAAVTAAGVRGGGEVILKPDTDYTIGATPLKFLYDDVTMVWGPNTRLVSSHATADIIQIGDDISEVSRVVLVRPRFWGSIQKTDGWCIHGMLSSRIDIENFMGGMREEYETGFSGAQTTPLYGGVWFDRFGTVKIEDGMKAYGIRGIKCNGDASGNYGAEVSINGYSEIFQSPQAVHLAGGVGGFYTGWVSISEGDAGVLFDRTEADIQNREYWADGQIYDNVVGSAIDIADGDTLRYFKQTGGWVSGCGNATGSVPAIHNGTGNDSLIMQIIGCEIKSSAARGIEHSSGFMRLTDSLVQSNADDGVYAAGTSTRVEINGNSINNNGGYGADLSSMGASSNTKLNDNSFFSNTTDDVNVPGAGTFKPANNDGFVTENKGTATITAGSTTVVVNHGLDYVPYYPQITPIGALGVGFGVQTLTATQFTIAISSALGGNQSFAWEFS